MGLDQYLYDTTPTLIPNSSAEEIAYWRKHWGLQNFIGTDNCKPIDITTELCDSILDNINNIYDNCSYHSDYIEAREYTTDVFTKAKQSIQNGRRITYEADW